MKEKIQGQGSKGKQGIKNGLDLNQNSLGKARMVNRKEKIIDKNMQSISESTTLARTCIWRRNSYVQACETTISTIRKKKTCNNREMIR